jgi:hypothetical protein
MTDATKTRPFEDTTRGDDTKPCKECNSPNHTTLGHVDGGSPAPVTANGHVDGGSMPVTTQGHVDGGSAT